MSTFFVTSIDVNVPVRTAYTQWTQFEDFPHFMEGVKAVQKLGDRRFHLEGRDRRQGKGVGRGDHRADTEPAHRLAESRRRHQRGCRVLPSSLG